MPTDTGTNQHVVLNMLADHGELSLMELRRRCVPTHMNLQGFDCAIGSLLRRERIHCKNKAKTKMLSLPLTKHLSSTEYFILNLLAQHPEPIERLVIVTARSLKISETGARMQITRLKNKGYVESLNIPKRGIYITPAGLEALGGTHGV